MAVKRKTSKRVRIQQEEETSSQKVQIHKPTKSSRRCSCHKTLLTVLIILVVLYVSPAFLIRYSHFIQKEFIYVNRVKIPFFANLSDPTGFGLPKTRHFNLEHENGCKIGVWQILPLVYHKQPVADNSFPNLLSDNRPIVLYLHGNTGTRAAYSRINVYKFLTEEKDYHVVTFDYKGFGDSDCSPSESGLMEDGLLVWQWIKTHAPLANMYIWGHSLGSGATIYLTSNLTASGTSPSGILLDAPFTTIIDAAYHHPFSTPYWPFIDIFKKLSLDFFHETHSSIDRVSTITCPILIMHGHKDVIIPFHLGFRLYEVALATRKPGSGKVQFIDCGDTGHKYNHRSENLRNALDTFIQ